jgi:signal peptidase II
MVAIDASDARQSVFNADLPMSDPTPSPTIAGRHAPSIILFIVIVLATLAADLAVKTWAFHNVAGEPLVLDRDPADGTTIVQTRDSTGELITRPRLRNGEPASAIPPHDPITIAPKLLALRLTINTGAVFGLGKGKQWVFVIVSILAVGVISYVFCKSSSKSRLFHITLALILGGALGNMYDRVHYNGVRDMCHLFPGVKLPFGWSWPGGADEVYPWIFNIADAALVVGVLILLALTWRADKKKPADQSKPG